MPAAAVAAFSGSSPAAAVLPLIPLPQTLYTPPRWLVPKGKSVHQGKEADLPSLERLEGVQVELCKSLIYNRSIHALLRTAPSLTLSLVAPRRKSKSHRYSPRGIPAYPPRSLEPCNFAVGARILSLVPSLQVQTTTLRGGERVSHGKVG